jgi:uncharacterized protein (TIGR02118 family)
MFMIKMIAFVRRHPSMTRPQFFDYWLNKHSPLVRSVPSFWQYVRGYRQNHSIQNFEFYASKEGDKNSNFDGAGEMWFDSIEDLKKAIVEPEYLSIIRPDELKCFDDPATVPMILAVEHIIVDKGVVA